MCDQGYMRSKRGCKRFEWLKVEYLARARHSPLGLGEVRWARVGHPLTCTSWRDPSLFLMKKTKYAIGDLYGHIFPDLRFFWRVESRFTCSTREGVDFAVGWLGVWLKFHGMIPDLLVGKGIEWLFGEDILKVLEVLRVSNFRSWSADSELKNLESLWDASVRPCKAVWEAQMNSVPKMFVTPISEWSNWNSNLGPIMSHLHLLELGGDPF